MHTYIITSTVQTVLHMSIGRRSYLTVHAFLGTKRAKLYICTPNVFIYVFMMRKWHLKISFCFIWRTFLAIYVMVIYVLSINRIRKKGRTTCNICLQTHMSLQAPIIYICKVQNKMYLKCQRRYKIVSNCVLTSPGAHCCIVVHCRTSLTETSQWKHEYTAGQKRQRRCMFW